MIRHQTMRWKISCCRTLNLSRHNSKHVTVLNTQGIPGRKESHHLGTNKARGNTKDRKDVKRASSQNTAGRSNHFIVLFVCFKQSEILINTSRRIDHLGLLNVQYP